MPRLARMITLEEHNALLRLKRKLERQERSHKAAKSLKVDKRVWLPEWIHGK